MSKVYVEHIRHEENYDTVSFSTSKVSDNVFDVPEWVEQYEFDGKDVEQCVRFIMSFLTWAFPGAREIEVVYERQRLDWVLNVKLDVDVCGTSVTSKTRSPSLDYRDGTYVMILYTCSEVVRRTREEISDAVVGKTRHDTRLEFQNV